MSQRFEDEETKFDTINLLQGVEASDLSLDEIMNEFGGWTVKPAPLTAGGKPHVEETKPAEPEPALVQRTPAPESQAKQPKAAEEQGGPDAGIEEQSRPAPRQTARAAGRTPSSAPVPVAGQPAGQAAAAAQASERTGVPGGTQKASRFHFVELDLNMPAQEREAYFKTPEAPLPASPVPNGQPEGQPFSAPRRSSHVIYPEETEEQEAEPDEAPDEAEEEALEEGADLWSDPAPAEQRRRKRSARKKAESEEPVRPEPSPAGGFRFYSKAVKQTRARMLPAMVMSILAAVLTVAAAMGWPLLPVFEEAGYRNLTLLALQVLTALLCFDVVARGIYDLMRLRFAVEGLVTAANALILLSAAVLWDAETPPFCAVGCFALTLTLWGSLQKKVAMRRSLKPLAAAERVTDVRRVSGLWSEGPCILKTAGEPEGFITDMEKPDRVDTVMGIYGPVLLAVTLVAAIALTRSRDLSFLWTWTALVCAGLPLAGSLCFSRPWSLIAARLMHSGAAISGWHGTRILAEAPDVTVQDEDLFPEGSVVMSGMKVFGPFRADLVVGYAASLIVPLGGGLAPLFRALQAEQGAQWFEPTGLRAFEGGGVGGDIRADVVLAGSMSFMQLMGVRLPKGTNVRQAVYVAINGELAGLFALSYQKAKGVQKGLRMLARAPGVRTVFAVRDFLMSPALLRQLFGLPADGLEYPRVEARLALSAPQEGAPGNRGAILTRDGLAVYAETVCGAVNLRSGTRRNLGLCMAGGILGVVLTVAAALLGLAQTGIPALAMAYGLVWSCVVIVSSAAASRY